MFNFHPLNLKVIKACVGADIDCSQCGCGSKLNRRGYADFGLCFHLPGQLILEFRFFEPRPCGLSLG